jgi:hypothetical protein
MVVRSWNLEFGVELSWMWVLDGSEGGGGTKECGSNHVLAFRH